MEKKINKLAKRLKRVEGITASTMCDKDFMDVLYEKARNLVVKHNKASIIFLQRKLLVDFERATRLLDEFEKNGVIGPEIGAGARGIIVSK